MNYLRNADDLMNKYAHNQACIFEQASRDNLPSYSFIKMYMCSKKVTDLDKIELVSDDEIYLPIKNKIKKHGSVLSSNMMHWIGYIYRSLSYLYDVSSRTLFYEVPPKYLVSIYPLYHSLDPVKAASKIYEEKLKTDKTNIDYIVNLMKQIY